MLTPTRILALVLLPLLCAAAEPASDFDALIDAARGAPAEFASDALVRIAAAERLGKERRSELLEDAFNRAAGAQEPFKRRVGVGGQASPAGFRGRAFQQDLDSLSLRLRSVDALLPIAPAAARRLFLQIPPLQLPAVTCEDALVYDADHFYQTLGRIVPGTFSPKEIREAEPLHVLLRYATSVGSPVQVAPVARLLASLTLKNEDLQALATAFAGALRETALDPRSFDASRAAGPAVRELAEACQRHDVSPLPLLEAYRLYLVKQSSGTRCADGLSTGAAQAFGFPSSSASSTTLAQRPGDPLDFFNEQLRVDPLQPIRPEEVSSAKTEGRAAGLSSCEDPTCGSLAEQYRALVLGPGGIAYSAEQQASPEWQNQFKQHLDALGEWTDSAGVPAAAQFREKCAFYSDLFNLAPLGKGREQVFRAMLDFLVRNSQRAPSRIEWFLPVNTLLGRVTLDPLGMGRSLDQLLRAEDPVVALYALLERALPRTPDLIVPLL